MPIQLTMCMMQFIRSTKVILSIVLIVAIYIACTGDTFVIPAISLMATMHRGWSSLMAAMHRGWSSLEALH